MPENMTLDIGGKLRAARNMRGLSLRELATQAEVSPSLISQIENGKANPSVMTLHTIAASLEIPINYFFPSDGGNDLEISPPPATESDEDASNLRSKHGVSAMSNVLNDGAVERVPTDPMVCATERARIELRGGVIWERLTPSSTESGEFLEIHYALGASSGEAMSRHPGREFGIVLEGELQLELGFERYVLKPGDSIIFDSTTPHRLTNVGQGEMRAVWVIFNSP
jgi:transcriptional regulator with XRE-family HTH domain/mannose-6-phosphate isomerase-like protein (cupin superfamily)